MWDTNPIFRSDLEKIISVDFIPWDEFNEKTFFVTGGTGLIGYTLISALLYRNKVFHSNIRIIALVRDEKRAKQKFAAQLEEGCSLSFIPGNVENIPSVHQKIDYIVHCAAPTSSVFMKENPAETICSIVQGTRNVLELAAKSKISGMVCLSSMEVYGEVRTRKKLDEKDLGKIDLTNPRSSYPEGKRIAELMCCAYAAEYDVPVACARLAQTFGPGVPPDDERVFAYMARCAVQKKDIVLNTTGEKENMYLYTFDAVSAILLLLCRGKKGYTYNTANESTYCSVRQMAEMVTEQIGEGKIKTVIRIDESKKDFYRSETFLYMDVSALKTLGWQASTGFPDMYLRMIRSGLEEGLNM